MRARPIPQLEKLSSLIWLQTSFLGDIVLQTAALDYVHRHFPEIRQYLITTAIGAKALADHPALYRCIVFEKRQKSMFEAVRMVKDQLRDCESQSTVMLQPHRSARSSLLAWSLGFVTVTYQETKLSSLADATVPRVAVLHETQRVGLLLEPLGVPREQVFATRPSLVPRLDPSALSVWGLGESLTIGIAPGSVWATKRWPVESFIRLGKQLLLHTNARLVILGSADEKAAAADLEQGLAADAARVINLAGRTSLDDLRTVYPSLSLLISNDSSPLHYASAFNVASLAIFGATVPALGFGPLADFSQVAQIALACRPCSDHGPMLCPLGHFRCMKDLEAERVADMALAILRQKGANFLDA